MKQGCFLKAPTRWALLGFGLNLHFKGIFESLMGFRVFIGFNLLANS